jgi:hypothetical protein
MALSSHNSGQPCRTLWSAVLLQAKEDLEFEPTGSTLHDQAVAFFVANGPWAESRAIVADLLEMHPDYLRSNGKRWIAERRTREGLPPEPPPSPRPVPARRPQLVASPAPDATVHAAARAAERQNRNGGRWALYDGINPFATHPVF